MIKYRQIAVYSFYTLLAVSTVLMGFMLFSAITGLYLGYANIVNEIFMYNCYLQMAYIGVRMLENQHYS